MKKVINFVVILGVFMAISSCKENTNIDTKDQDQCITSKNVKGIFDVNADLISVFNNNFSSNKKIINYDIDNAKVIEFKNTNVKSIVSVNKNDKDEAFITYYDPNKNSFINTFIIQININNNIETANFLDENGNPNFLVKYNMDTGKILEVKSTNSNKTFYSCMQTAYSSCYADWACALECDIAGFYCWAAWGIACAVVQ